MYDPIYSNNLGLVGYRCRCTPECVRIVPTYRGIVMHCKRVHGMTAQIEFPYPKEQNDVRHEDVKSDDDGKTSRSVLRKHARKLSDAAAVGDARGDRKEA